jgi:hypothetical protein
LLNHIYEDRFVGSGEAYCRIEKKQQRKMERKRIKGRKVKTRREAYDLHPDVHRAQWAHQEASPKLHVIKGHTSSETTNLYANFVGGFDP